MVSENIILAFVIPCYNEEEVLDKMILELKKHLDILVKENLVSEKSFIYLVDDGSKDNTWDIIEKLHISDSLIKGLKLAGNVGHQKALLAGMLSCGRKCDCMITMDADLQDDVSVVKEMIQKFKEGFQIVYGVRNERTNDSFFKKNTAQGFYSLMNLMKVKIVYNHADFRLISQKVVLSLEEYKEVNLFLRAIFPDLGFKSTKVFYKRLERQAGISKYPLRKMLSFAWEGITSFTVMPLRYITILGFFTLFITILLSGWTVFSVIRGTVVPGWASTVLPMYFLGAVQLLSLGIIGEYISKIYKEVKGRPRFIKEIELF